MERRHSRRAAIGGLALALAPALTPAVAAAAAPPGLPRLPGVAPRTQSAADLVAVRVAADVASVEPGATFHVAVVFEIAPHWHIYWSNPGDAGLPTELAVRVPEGFTVGAVRYPRPEAFDEPDGRTFGYQREAVLFVPVTAPAHLEPGSIDVEVDANFLICKGRCLLGQATRTLRLDTGPRGSASAPGAAARDLRARIERLPQPLAKLPGARATLVDDGDGRRLVITTPRRGFDTVAFFPFDAPGVTCGEAVVTTTAESFRVAVPFEARARNALGRPMHVGGVIGLGKMVDAPSYVVDLPVDASR